MKITFRNHDEVQRHMAQPDAAPVYIYVEGVSEKKGLVLVEKVIPAVDGYVTMAMTEYGFWANINHTRVKLISADS